MRCRTCWKSLVQQGIELSPNLIFLCAGDVAIGAFLQLSGLNDRPSRTSLRRDEAIATPHFILRGFLGVLDLCLDLSPVGPTVGRFIDADMQAAE